LAVGWASRPPCRVGTAHHFLHSVAFPPNKGPKARFKGTFFGEDGTFDRVGVPADAGISANCTAAAPRKTGGVGEASRVIGRIFRWWTPVVAEQKIVAGSRFPFAHKRAAWGRRKFGGPGPSRMLGMGKPRALPFPSPLRGKGGVGVAKVGNQKSCHPPPNPLPSQGRGITTKTVQALPTVICIYRNLRCLRSLRMTGRQDFPRLHDDWLAGLWRKRSRRERRRRDSRMQPRATWRER
jgi:hypothetical protein